MGRGAVCAVRPYMYALCVPSAKDTQGFVGKFLCDMYTFSFITIRP